MSTEAINGATDAVKKDVVIVRSSRAGNGIVTHEKWMMNIILSHRIH